MEPILRSYVGVTASALLNRVGDLLPAFVKTGARLLPAFHVVVPSTFFPFLLAL
jgi:hypothetical protein